MFQENIIDYCKKYPMLEIQDLFKYVFQSSFGCEHLISDPSHIASEIQKELNEAKEDYAPAIEYLDGDFSRVHLSILKEGLSIDTLSKLFYLSSKENVSGVEKLEEYLNILLILSKNGKIEVDYQDLEEKIKEWKSKGYPPLHHSKKYNDNYHPAYRLISNKFLQYLTVFKKIDSYNNKVICAIDGPCTSGKTYLSNILSQVYDCNIFNMDDFFLQPHQRTEERLNAIGENVDHERFLSEVLLPLSNNEEIKYQRYDCHSGKLLEATTITPKRINIIEGVYSQRPELLPYYNFTVYLKIEKDKQKERILSRNPQMAKRFFDEWIPKEDIYFKHFKIEEKANIVI